MQSYVKTRERPARIFWDAQRGVTAQSPADLKRSVFRRWVASFVDPAEAYEVNIILDPRRIAEPGYVLREFKAWGGWCQYQFEALQELIARRPKSSFGGDLYIALMDRTGYNVPTYFLTGR